MKSSFIHKHKLTKEDLGVKNDNAEIIGAAKKPDTKIYKDKRSILDFFCCKPQKTKQNFK